MSLALNNWALVVHFKGQQVDVPWLLIRADSTKQPLEHQLPIEDLIEVLQDDTISNSHSDLSHFHQVPWNINTWHIITAITTWMIMPPLNQFECHL